MSNYGKRHTGYNGIIIWLQEFLGVSVPKNNKTHQHIQSKAVNKVMRTFLENATECVSKKSPESNVDKVQKRFEKFKIWAKDNKQEIQNLLNES